MKRLYPLLFISVLIYWGCEEPKEEEITPTEVTLWGVVYSVEDTDTLSLYLNQVTGVIPPEIGNLTNLSMLILEFNQLTGSVPSEIGNLTNLTYLWLNDNQLSGLISESICDLDINWSSSIRFKISNNKLCPPYPSCLTQSDVGEQDTSNCEE